MTSLFRTGLPAFVMVVGLGFLALLPLLAEWVDNIFLIDLFMRLMILSIAAVGLNLILGYGGMVSFGHAAYLVIGAYAVGIPAYYDIYDGFLQFAIAILASAAVALVTGAIALRSRCSRWSTGSCIPASAWLSPVPRGTNGGCRQLVSRLTAIALPAM